MEKLMLEVPGEVVDAVKLPSGEVEREFLTSGTLGTSHFRLGERPSMVRRRVERVIAKLDGEDALFRMRGWKSAYALRPMLYALRNTPYAL